MFILKPGNKKGSTENVNIFGKYLGGTSITEVFSHLAPGAAVRATALGAALLPWQSRWPPTGLDFRNKTELKTPSLIDFQ